LFFDPGGVIKREGLGEVANGNLDLLVNSLESVENTEEFAGKARSYVENQHVLNDLKIKEIDKLFKELHIVNKI
jgi:hypothetical protein